MATWFNQHTFGLGSIWNLFGVASNDVWATGLNTDVFHWDGNAWNSVNKGLGETRCVWGSATDNFWMGGASGSSEMFWNWDGVSWTPDTGFADIVAETIVDIWGITSDDMWAVSREGTIYRNDSGFGGWFNYVNTPFNDPMMSPGVEMYSVFGAASNDVWIGGQKGNIYHWNGATWGVVPMHLPGHNTESIFDTFGFATNDVWMAGGRATEADGGVTIYHWNGSVWSLVYENAGIGDAKGCWGTSSNDIWFSCTDGTILHWNGSSMSVYTTFGGASLLGMWGFSATDIWLGAGDTNAVVYRYGSPPEAGLPIIEPTSGLITGGDSFIIADVNLSNSDFADTFTGMSLDVSKWTDLSSFGGSISTGVDGLFLHTPGLSTVQSVTAYKNFDAAISYAFDSSVSLIQPSQQVFYAMFAIATPAPNYMYIQHLWDPQAGPIVRVVRVDNGVTTILTQAHSATNAGILRFIRVAGRVRAYLGGQLFYDLEGWHTDDVNILILSAMPATVPVSPKTHVTAYTPNLVVTFGNDICDFAQESPGGRTIGSTPATKLPVGVDVQIHSVTNTKTCGPNAFQYTAPLQLTISRNGGSVVINNDNTLRDSSVTQQGFDF